MYFWKYLRRSVRIRVSLAVTRFVFVLKRSVRRVGAAQMQIANGKHAHIHAWIRINVHTYVLRLPALKYAIHTSKSTLRYITHWPHNSCSSQRRRRHRQRRQLLCQTAATRADKGSPLGEHSLRRRRRRRKMWHLTHLWKSESECAAKLILLECFVVKKQQEKKQQNQNVLFWVRELVIRGHLVREREEGRERDAWRDALRIIGMELQQMQMP